jgi:hypothetical protein
MMKMISWPLQRIALSLSQAGGMRPIGSWLIKMRYGWQGLQQEMRPFQVRWGWALLLAIVLVLAMGELGPAASAVAALP